MNIHDKIHWARNERGWTVEQLSEASHLDPMLITDIESHFDGIIMSELVKIAEALKRDIDFFLSEDEPDDPVFLHCKDMCSTCRQDERSCKDA